MNRVYIDLVPSKRVYSGIETEGADIFRYFNKKDIKQYLSLFDGERIPFSENNLFALMSITDHIKELGIIVFGEKKVDFPKGVNGNFLGYDVSGDSMHLSPLYTAFFGNDGGQYFQDLQSKLSCGVNEYGLFDSIESAIELIGLVNAAKDDNVFETDGQLKPVYIYKVC